MSYTRVNKLNPCPVCKKPDWCRVFADGWVECMRVQSDRPAKSGGWLHRPGESGANDSHLRPPPKWQPPTINATKLMRNWLAKTEPGLLADLALDLGLSVAVLAAAGAAWATPHAAWAFPMCDGHGNILGIRLRANDGRKWAVRGSRQGIFLGNWNKFQLQVESDSTCGLTAPDDTAQPTDSGRSNSLQIIANQRNEVVQPCDSVGLMSAATANGSQSRTLFVCEGPTDTAAALELGLFAVGRPNCCCGGAAIKVFARRHQCNRVVMISDNDKPGLDGACKVGAEIGLPFAVYVPPAKDLREFVRLGGTRAMIENTLKGTIWRNG